MSKVNTFLLMSKEKWTSWRSYATIVPQTEASVDDLIEAKDVVKLHDISRATLTRWMNPDWARHRGIDPFPQGRMKDGRTKVWSRAEVAEWVSRNHEHLGRHPKIVEYVVDRSASVELSLTQSIGVVRRIAEEDELEFDDFEFEETFIEPIVARFFEAARRRGVKGVQWVGNEFSYVFPEGDSGDRDAVAFKLTFA